MENTVAELKDNAGGEKWIEFKAGIWHNGAKGFCRSAGLMRDWII